MDIINMNEYLTWDFLGGFVGMVAVVTLIIEFLKFQTDKVWKIPTRYLVYVISVVLLFITEYFTKGVVVEKIPLLFLNGILVTMTSMGVYDGIVKKIEERIKGLRK